MRPRNETVTVRVDGSRITIAGRTYRGAHIVLIGVSTLRMAVEPERVAISANFDELPEIEDVSPDVLRVRAPGASLELDLDGSTIMEVSEDKGSISIRARNLTLKFDTNPHSGRVTVKVPRMESLTVNKLVITSNTRASVNAIIEPFITGVVSLDASGGARIYTSKRDGALRIEA